MPRRVTVLFVPLMEPSPCMLQPPSSVIAALVAERLPVLVQPEPESVSLAFEPVTETSPWFVQPVPPRVRSSPLPAAMSEELFQFDPVRIRFPPAVSSAPVLDQPSPSRVIVWFGLSARIVPWLTKAVPGWPTLPEMPWIRIPGPMVRVPLEARTKFWAVGPTNSTSPVPSRTAGGCSSRVEGEPPKVPEESRSIFAPVSVRPFIPVRTTPTFTLPTRPREQPSSTELAVVVRLAAVLPGAMAVSRTVPPSRRRTPVVCSAPASSTPPATRSSPPMSIRVPTVRLPPSRRRSSRQLRLRAVKSPPLTVTWKAPAGRSITTSSVGPGTCPVLQLAGSLQAPFPSRIHSTVSLTTITPASVNPPGTGSRPTRTPLKAWPPTSVVATRLRSPSLVGTSAMLKKPLASAVAPASTSETSTAAPAAGVPSANCTKPSTVVRGSPRVTITETTALVPSLLAVMKATPSPTAVISPSLSTVAMAGLLVT